MKYLTKKVRHHIYKRALEIRRKGANAYELGYGILKPHQCGLCLSLTIALLEQGFNAYVSGNNCKQSPYYHMDKYPEIYKHCPDRLQETWFPYDDEGNKQRIRVLKQAIKETT